MQDPQPRMHDPLITLGHCSQLTLRAALAEPYFVAWCEGDG